MLPAGVMKRRVPVPSEPTIRSPAYGPKLLGAMSMPSVSSPTLIRKVANPGRAHRVDVPSIGRHDHVAAEGRAGIEEYLTDIPCADGQRSE